MSKPLRNDLLLRAARRQPTERTPVWLMRQAGRFDPAYMAVRNRDDAPLEVLFSTPEIAAEISLLPRRFGVDAIIFFQDILTPLTPLGAPFVFRPGPVLTSPIRTADDVDRLTPYDPAAELPFVADTLRLLRRELDGTLPLLGFAGAPLTLLFFMAEGTSPGSDGAAGHAMLRNAPDTAHRLLALLADLTADYLALQIEAGADAVQLFESCADLLSPEQYRTFAHPYQVRVLERLGRRVPTILFARERPELDLLVETGADVLSLGKCVDLATARAAYGHRVAFQGNVDNQLLATATPDEVAAATRACLTAGAHHGHILNLNHGLLRTTPVANVERFIATAHTFTLTNRGPAATPSAQP